MSWFIITLFYNSDKILILFYILLHGNQVWKLLHRSATDYICKGVASGHECPLEQLRIRVTKNIYVHGVNYSNSQFRFV